MFRHTFWGLHYITEFIRNNEKLPMYHAERYISANFYSTLITSSLVVAVHEIR